MPDLSSFITIKNNSNHVFTRTAIYSKYAAVQWSPEPQLSISPGKWDLFILKDILSIRGTSGYVQYRVGDGPGWVRVTFSSLVGADEVAEWSSGDLPDGFVLQKPVRTGSRPLQATFEATKQ